MRVLIDETVLVEYVGERRPYCACWDKLNALEMVGYAELWATPDAYRAMAASLREALPGNEVDSALLATLEYVNVCSVERADVAYALGCGASFKVGLLDSCARKIKADYVVTRCTDEQLPSGRVPLVTPEGMFDHLEETQGLVFDLVDL